MIICGFEAGSTTEYTAQSGLTIASTATYVSPNYGTIGAAGYVYWTISDSYSGTVSISTNVKLPLSGNIKPIKVTRGGSEFSVGITSTKMTRTITLTAGAYSENKTMVLTSSAWHNLVLVVGYGYIAVYLNQNRIIHYITPVTNSNGTITELRCLSTTGIFSVDDVALWHGTYESGIVIVQPYVPASVRLEQLTPGDATGGYNWEFIDEYTSDGDTSYLLGTGGLLTDFYGCAVPNVVLGLTLNNVLGINVHAEAKTMVDTGDEHCNTGIRLGDSGTAIWSSDHNLSTSYVMFTDNFESAGSSGLFMPSHFTNLNYQLSLQIGIALHPGAGETARVTKVRASVLCLYKVYTPGKNLDIVLTGGFDISCDVSTTGWANNDYLSFYTNVSCVPIGSLGNSGDTQTAITFYYTTTAPAGIYVKLGTYPTAAISMECMKVTATLGTMHLRIVLHDNYCSVFNCGRWIYTFSMSSTNYPASLTLYAITNRTGQSLTNVVAAELADWREAIYIDMESSIASGISSVIQERPVEILPLQGGIADFSYNRTRSQISPANILRHVVSEANSSQAGSHYIVYYKDVAVVVDEDFMDNNGYLSRMLQMSQLDSGAVDAAAVISQRNKESQERHRLEISPDIRIEPGDRVNVSYTLSGTGRVVSTSFIAENVSFNMQEGAYGMVIEGRKYV